LEAYSLLHHVKASAVQKVSYDQVNQDSDRKSRIWKTFDCDFAILILQLGHESDD